MRCVWCHGSAGQLSDISVATGEQAQQFWVHAEHEAPARRFLEGAASKGRLVVILIATISLLAIGAIVVGIVLRTPQILAAAASCMLVAFAGVLFAWPLATPQTVDSMGLQKAILTVRVVSISLVGLAILIGIQGSRIPMR